MHRWGNCLTLIGDAHTLEYWTGMAKQVEAREGNLILHSGGYGGLLLPYQATELVDCT